MLGVVGVARGSISAGVAAAGESEVVHVEDGGDLAAGIEDTSDNCCVDIWHVALKHQGGTGHGDAGDTDVVFNAKTLTGELAGLCAFDRTATDDSIERVVLATRPCTRVALAVRDGRQMCRRLVQGIKGGEHLG